jgi:hypothetical protein
MQKEIIRLVTNAYKNKVEPEMWPDKSIESRELITK